MNRETGKQRAQRIELNYYRKPGPLYWSRYVFAGLGLFSAIAYVAYALNSGSASHISTGPLAMSHASFEKDCQKCHQADLRELKPVDAQAAQLSFNFLGITLKSCESIEHIAKACRECHPVGDHHFQKMTKDGQLLDQNCGLCHADHQGRDHDLVAVANKRCTTCHEELNRFCEGSTVRNQVTGFTKKGHSEFTSLTNGDPGRVKFDHYQHMQPGQIVGAQRGPMSLDMLDDIQRER